MLILALIIDHQVYTYGVHKWYLEYRTMSGPTSISINRHVVYLN